MNTQKVNFKIFRFNSESDYLPAYKTYEIDVCKNDVVLDILNKVKNEIDGSFSYRRSCRHGICGICGVKVNSKSILACKQNVYELIEQFGHDLVIEPQDTKRAVKDLIIDKSDYWAKYNSVNPCLVAKPNDCELENIVSQDDALRIDNADYCIECGACYYACQSLSVNENFLGPAALTKTYRFTSDVRDNAKQDRLEIVNKPLSGIWDCVKCYACTEVCPKGIDPMGKITRLCNQSFAFGVVKDNPAAASTSFVVNSIQNSGLLDNSGFMSFGDSGFMPQSFGMVMHEKIPLFGGEKCEKIDEIKTLMRNTKGEE